VFNHLISSLRIVERRCVFIPYNDSHRHSPYFSSSINSSTAAAALNSVGNLQSHGRVDKAGQLVKVKIAVRVGLDLSKESCNSCTRREFAEHGGNGSQFGRGQMHTGAPSSRSGKLRFDVLTTALLAATPVWLLMHRLQPRILFCPGSRRAKNAVVTLVHQLGCVHLQQLTGRPEMPNAGHARTDIDFVLVTALHLRQ
jgi:hypothetical protein